MQCVAGLEKREVGGTKGHRHVILSPFSLHSLTPQNSDSRPQLQNHVKINLPNGPQKFAVYTIVAFAVPFVFLIRFNASEKFSVSSGNLFFFLIHILVYLCHRYSVQSSLSFRNPWIIHTHCCVTSWCAMLGFMRLGLDR